MNDRFVVYEPNQRVKMGFIKGWREMAGNVAGSRELVWQLFKRDFFSNYKQSFLGIIWIFIAPVVAILSWVFLSAAGILKPGDVGVPYPVYVLLGGTIWGLFIGVFSTTARSLTDSGGMILQIKFPHEALVVKQMAQTVAAFVINLVLISAVLLVFSVAPSWKAVFFPLAVAPLLLVGAGLGMIVSVISAVAHDFEKAVTACLGFLMYLTPVIYSAKAEGGLIKAVVYLNPLAYLVGGARDLILYGGMESPYGYMASAGMAAAFFLFSWRLFFLSEHKVAERL